MSKITILKIKNEDKVSEKGKNYVKCSIKTKDKNGQEVWIGGWGNTTTKGWHEGDQVDLDIYQEIFNNKTYLKFRDVKERNMFVELDRINAKLDILLGVVTSETINKPKSTAEELGLLPEQQEEEPVETHSPGDIKPEDIPF